MPVVPPNVRARLAAVPGLKPAVQRGRLTAQRLRQAVRPVPFAELPHPDVIRLAYEVVLDREPDAAADELYREALATGRLTPREIVDRLRTSDEHRARTPIGGTTLLESLHLSRCEFIIGLPPSRRIIDLGGAHTANPWGAMVLLGYPYEFDELVIVDLPGDDRHELYRSSGVWGDTLTPKGLVRYEYRSMADLSFADDDATDLVYSGQSIEHVSRDDARKVVHEAFRVLRPGGHFALDTPNAPICRLHSADFIDPDHEHEYSLDELVDLLEEGGFEVVERKGLNLATRSRATGTFDAAEIAAHHGVYADAESCYLLAVVARKPPAPLA
jgi:SAM-dependent methyltransferase